MFRYLLPAALILIALSDVQIANAQLFGQRNLGESLSRRARPGSSGGEGAGELRGNERFVRGNRSARDFVGSDMADTGRFVGVQQGRSRGTIRSAITNLRPPRDQNVNQPQARRTPPTLPYAPRLQLGFVAPALAPGVVAEGISERLVDALSLRHSAGPMGHVQVSLQGRTAILQGEVASEHERALAEQLTLLEAGVSEVLNELTIVVEPGPEELPPAATIDTPPNRPGDRSPRPFSDR